MKIQSDKIKHFIVGFALGFVCVAFAIVAGWTKERIDQARGGEFDTSDMIATWLGGAIGQCASVLMITLIA